MLSWKLNIWAFKNINRFGTKSCSFWMKICKMCEKLTKNCHRAVKLTPFKVLSWKFFASYQKILFSFSESWIIELEKILCNDRPIMSPSGSKLAKCKIFRKSKNAMKQNHYNELQNRFSQQKRILPICREPVFDYYHHVGSESVVTSEAWFWRWFFFRGACCGFTA